MKSTTRTDLCLLCLSKNDVHIWLILLNSIARPIYLFVLCLVFFLCSVYNELKYCVDDWEKATWCKGHKFLVDKFFLTVHRKYFGLCGQVHDPPFTTLIMLIAPCIIITFLLPLLCLKLTTWNTEMPCTVGL